MQKVFGLFLVLLGAAACLELGDGSRDEVARVTSPSGDVDAVVVETNHGATTSFGYEVHVVRKGGSPSAASEVAYLYGALRNDRAYGVSPCWRTADSLVVEYLGAEDVVRQVDRTTAADRQVKITLVSGVRDMAAPPGGMLYNLRQGRKQ